MTKSAPATTVGQIHVVLPEGRVFVKVGVEGCGHYHPPLLTPSVWPSGLELLELNPAHVGEQRRVLGRRRVKTGGFDLKAITELLLTGRGIPVTVRKRVVGELTAWTDSSSFAAAVAARGSVSLQGMPGRPTPESPYFPLL